MITITKQIMRELEGLYVNQIVKNKYQLTDKELVNVIDKNKDYAVSLDKLGVPWKIQNKVAFEGTKPENWERYNKEVLREAIKKYLNYET